MSQVLQEIPRIEVDDLKRKGEAGKVLIVDVRRPDAYAAGHIPGALSIGLQAIAAGTHGLPRDQEIVLYCT